MTPGPDLLLFILLVSFIFLIFRLGLLLDLVLLQDVGRQLMLHVARLARPTSQAVVVDDLVLDLVGRLWELAGRT